MPDSFISIVLLINATIGTIQEYSAAREAEALRGMIRTRASALRERVEIDAEELVPETSFSSSP